MKVELLVSEWCPTCPKAEQVWRQVAEEKDFEFAVVDLAQPEGRERVARLRLKSVPSLIIDGELKAVGVVSLAEARALVAQAPPKAKSGKRYPGMLLDRDNRLFILSSIAYFMLAGAALVANGGLLPDGPWREAGLHLYTVGFGLFLIYGLGAHMLPRFTGNPIALGPWPWLQMALAHLGLWLYIPGSVLASRWVAFAGGALLWLSLVVFAIRLGPVLWPRHPRVPASRAARP